MAEPVVEDQSQPASDAASITRKHFEGYRPDVDETPQAEAGEADAPVVETFDPATIRIPNRQFVEHVPKALEKFKDKTLVDFATSYEEAERMMHAKAAEAAQTRRENEELRTRLTAAEQYARMSQQPAPTAQQHDPYEGLDVDTAGVTDMRGFADRTLAEARRIAKEEAATAAQQSRAQVNAERETDAHAAQLVTAFELSRAEVGKLIGRDVPIEEWQSDLQDLARIVHSREPHRQYDHKAYVETYVRLRGVPKVSVPTEGNPPIAARPASVKPDKPTPTLSREADQLNKQIRKALNLDS